MYDFKTNERIFDDDKKTGSVYPTVASADHTMAYAKEVFKRLTGYRAEERPFRSPITGAAGARVYAEDMFARMRGRRPDHPYDYGYYLDGCPLHAGHGARGEGQAPGIRSDGAMIPGGKVFRRLCGLSGQKPVGPERRPDTVRVAPSSTSRAVSLARAVKEGVMRLALLIRRLILEPYARRRRRKIGIAQLQALDERILADIGVQRNDIERIVDRLLAADGEGTLVAPPRLRRTDTRREVTRMAA